MQNFAYIMRMIYVIGWVFQKTYWKFNWKQLNF